jgi:hypothetical protein
MTEHVTKAHLPIPGDPMYEATLALFRYRESLYPEHHRRAAPDISDLNSGRWARMAQEADAVVSAYLASMRKPPS